MLIIIRFMKSQCRDLRSDSTLSAFVCLFVVFFCSLELQNHYFLVCYLFGDILLFCIFPLTHYRKPLVFLMFSVGVEKQHRAVMG